jgi:mRNA-degrading endonuclease toxin of MazEF toxin-antitoxin module
MKRGDVVVVAAAGDYGKPGPAVIVQTNAIPEAHTSVVICRMTSENEEVGRLNTALACVMGLAG